MVQDHGVSIRRACQAARLARSAFYVPRRVRDDGPVIAAIEGYVHDNPWSAVGVAATAGLLMGILVAKR